MPSTMLSGVQDGYHAEIGGVFCWKSYNFNSG